MDHHHLNLHSLDSKLARSITRKPASGSGLKVDPHTHTHTSSSSTSTSPLSLEPNYQGSYYIKELRRKLEYVLERLHMYIRPHNHKLQIQFQPARFSPVINLHEWVGYTCPPRNRKGREKQLGNPSLLFRKKWIPINSKPPLHGPIQPQPSMAHIDTSTPQPHSHPHQTWPFPQPHYPIRIRNLTHFRYPHPKSSLQVSASKNLTIHITSTAHARAAPSHTPPGPNPTQLPYITTPV